MQLPVTMRATTAARLLALLGGVTAAGCLVTTESSDGEEPARNVCPDTSEPTRGELGVVDAIYDVGTIGCLFGCSASDPIATGALAEIVLVGDAELPKVAFSSDDPSVAEFEYQGGARLRVTTHAPGNVRLEIKNADTGELIDAIGFVVKDVSAIELSEEERITVMQGGRTSLDVTLRDEHGCRMVGVGGVEYVLSDGISEVQVGLADALFDWLFGGIFGGVVDEHVSIEALEVGEGKLEVRARRGPTASLPIAVVDASAVSSVELRLPSEIEQVGESYPVEARALLETGEHVRDPLCAWSLTPPDGPVTFSWTGRDSARVTSGTAAAATVSCRIGSAGGSIDVVFP